eukprot:6859152-Pyramimonas_sp.AAC.2
MKVKSDNSRTYLGKGLMKVKSDNSRTNFGTPSPIDRSITRPNHLNSKIGTNKHASTRRTIHHSPRFRVATYRRMFSV